MKPLVMAAVASFGLLVGLAAEQARAQGPYVPPRTNPYAQPILSPYLNLLRPGNAAVNYYGIVRPQEQFRTAIQGLQQQADLSQQATTTAQPGLSTTGHATAFLNYSHYYALPGTQRTGGFTTRASQGQGNRGLSSGALARPTIPAAATGAAGIGVPSRPTIPGASGFLR